MPKPILMPIAAPGATAAPEMDCASFERLLAEVLDRERLPPRGRQHLRQCAACERTLATYESIARQVRQLPSADLEPANDLWPHIAARLREEGVIHANEDDCRTAMAPHPPAPRLVPSAPESRR